MLQLAKTYFPTMQVLDAILKTVNGRTELA